MPPPTIVCESKTSAPAEYDGDDREVSPPPAGSLEELLETAAVVGYPGALLHTCRDSERLIRLRLLWEE